MLTVGDLCGLPSFTFKYFSVISAISEAQSKATEEANDAAAHPMCQQSPWGILPFHLMHMNSLSLLQPPHELLTHYHSFFLSPPKCLSIYLSASLSVYMKHCLFNQGTRDDNYWLLEDLQFEKTRWKKRRFWCWAVRRIKELGENQLMGGNYSNSFFHFPYYLHSLLFCRCDEIPRTKATQRRKYLFWFIVPEPEQWGQAMKL